MYYKTPEAALKAYHRFITEYYDGDASNLLHHVSHHVYGYCVSVYDLNGNFLTLV